ncbi:MAG: YfhO family protein [Verrucomicrobia bacterium]|nr:YfhO family protein [Verrucomicrobiota bacterium]
MKTAAVPCPPIEKTVKALNRRHVVLFLIYALVLLGVLFRESFLPDKAHFSNDGPLGAIQPLSAHVASDYFGRWLDLNWVGAPGGASAPNFSFGLMMLVGAVGYAKFYAPFALLILGLCAWFFFRQLKFGPVVCVLGGLAAILNSGFFSTACWGVAGQCITFGMAYLALGLLADEGSARRWLRVVLAGLAVGMGLMEGADIGAIFSLYVAAFVVFQALTAGNGFWTRVVKGAVRTAVVAVFAALIAAQFISVMISTQIKGVAGSEQDTQTREQRWEWATQWSLPKAETLSFAVPGLFGYRMETPDGGQYWGIIGRFPGWKPEFGPGGARYTGGGIYSGILVLLIGAWAVAQACRRRGSVYTDRDRKWILFWSGAAGVSLLLAWGKYAPFYQVLYALPYFSNIRNPAKFTHCFNWAVVVLFAYGAHGMFRAYVGESLERVAKWFAGFEKAWTLGLVGTVGVAVAGAAMYAGSRRALEAYLERNGFNLAEARPIIEFSNGQVGMFILFLLLSVAAIVLLQRRTFTGPRARWAGVLLGVILVADLARANLPWIQHYDYREKYASNAVVDLLRQRPFEHRVAILPWRVNQEMALLQQIYNVEWLQHHFQYYGVQSIDVIQEPRVAVDNQTYRALWISTNVTVQWQPGNPILRHWQLANVRYLLGLASMTEALNQQLDPAQRRFRTVLPFDFPKLRMGDVSTIQTNAAGPFALIEFTGALPRAGLYTQWTVATNAQAALNQIASPAFDPAQLVVVSGNVSPPPAPPPTNPPAASVEFVPDQYTPKHVALRTQANAPTVLLLADKYDPNWRVTVDGRPAVVLRCNYLMRGVELPPGRHDVVFRFQPPATALYVSLAGVVLALVLTGYLATGRGRTRTGEGAHTDP